MSQMFKKGIQCLLLGIENTVLLENLCYNGYCRVDRVGDDEYESFGGISCDSGSKIPNNACVDL